MKNKNYRDVFSCWNTYFVVIRVKNFIKRECSCPRRKKKKYPKCWCKRENEMENVLSVWSLDETTSKTMLNAHTDGIIWLGENIGNVKSNRCERSNTEHKCKLRDVTSTNRATLSHDIDGNNLSEKWKCPKCSEQVNKSSSRMSQQ